MSPSNYQSQYGQDQIIDKLLKGKTGGFFVDIGAHDGITFSNSYFFEKVRNYRGICFEPIPNVFKKLVNNRTCECINGAVFEKNEKVKFTLCTDYAEMLSGISSYREQEHVERTQKDIQKHGGEVFEIDVQGYNLNDFLKGKNISKIDFISMDIEGGELNVLETINFIQLDVKVLAIELNFPDTEKEIRRFVEVNNFKFLFRVESDGIFVNKKHFSSFNFSYLKLSITNKLSNLKKRIMYRLKIISKQ